MQQRKHCIRCPLYGGDILPKNFCFSTYTTFDNFLPLRSAWQTPPRLMAADASQFSCVRRRPCGRGTTHPSGSRLRDVSLASQTSALCTCRTPENRQFPAVSNVYRSQCHGSLEDPVSTWLTAEASPDSTIRWEAIGHRLRSGCITRLVMNHCFSTSPTPTQLVARPQPKALWTSNGSKSRMRS